MTDVDKDRFSSVAIAMRVEEEPSFMLLLTRAGMIRRMGFSAFDDEERTVADGHDEELFAEFMERVPGAVLRRGGTYEADGTEGQRCDCRIEFGGDEPVRFDLVYYSRSAGLPQAISDLIEAGEQLTDGWYAERIGRDLTDDDGEGTSEADTDEDDAESALAKYPAASKQRIALAVLLDLFVLLIPYAFLSLLFSGGGRVGAWLFVFVFVEFALLQFVRQSPGYWLLGLTGALLDGPRVDPALILRESLVTHIVGVAFLRSGIDGLLSWAAYETPIPYFGFSLGPALSALFSIVIGACFVAAGVLIFRTDLRGVWVGAGATAFSFLAVWFARGRDLDTWVGAEIAARRALQGRTVDPGELDAVVSFMGPLIVIIPLLYGVGLFFTWKRFKPSSPIVS